MRQIILVIFIFVACLVSYVRADMLYLKNGNEYKGTLTRITEDSVSFKIDETNQIREFSRSDILKLELSAQRAGAEAAHLTALKDKLLSSRIANAPGAEDYLKSGYVTLYEKVTITINPDLSSTQTRRVIHKVLQERSVSEVANRMFSYRSQDESIIIDFARTIHPSGNVFHLADNATEDGSVHSTIPEYEGLRQIKFALPKVKVGAIVDYQITCQKKPISLLAPGLIEEHFRYREPLLQKIVTIIIPRDINLDIMFFRNEDIAAKLTEDKKQGIKKYTWTVTNAPRIVDEPNMPEYADIVPRLVVSIHNDWIDIGRAYLKVLEKNLTPSDELKAKVQALIKYQTIQSEQIKALYNYVAQSIRYINVSPPDYSYAPKPLTQIFQNKFGNSLDKAYLLYGMLKLAGLKPYFLWIRPQSRGEFTKRVNSLGQLSVPLVVIPAPWCPMVISTRDDTIDNQLKYLNPFFDTVSADVLLSDYQGVHGLLIGQNKTRLIKTPLYPPANEAKAKTFRIALAPDGSLLVARVLSLNGNHERELRQHKDLRPTKMKKLIQSWVNQIHPKATLIDYQLSDLKNMGEPVWLTLKYSIPDYALKAGEELLVFQLPEINYTAQLVGKEQRTFPLDWQTTRQETNQATIIIPAGYKINYLPKNYSAKSSWVSYQAELKSKGQKIFFNDRFSREVIFLLPDQYADFKKCLETRARFAKEWIVLEKVK